MGITISGGMSFSGGLTVISPVTGASGSSWIAYLSNPNNTNNNIQVTKMAVDASGNVYASGSQYPDTLTLFPFLVKFSTDGVLQWQRQFSGLWDMNGVSLSGTDPVFGGTRENSPNVYDLAVGKCDSSGTLQWSRALGNSTLYEKNDTTSRSISTDSAGNIFLVGYAYTSGYTDVQFLIAKYNSSGVLQWQRTLGSSSQQEFQYATATDSTGAVYIAGEASGLDAGGATSYIAKYSSSGTLLWQRYIGNSSVNKGRSVATDSSDNVFLLTITQQTTNVAKYDSSGTLQWQTNITGSGNGVNPEALATDSAGNVYITGNNNIDASTQYTIVVKLNSSGTHQWSRYMGITGSRQFRGLDIQVDTSGNYYVVNEYDPDGAPKMTSFITKLPTDGTRTGTYSVGGISFTYASISLTISSGTLTGGTPSLPSSTSSLSEGAAGLSASTGNLTVTTTTIASS